MIDTRLPVQPKKILLPLYRLSSSYSKQGNLYKKLSLSLPPSGQLILSESATTALLSLLYALDKNNLRIGLPAFFCPRFAYECLRAGHSLIFYDLSSDFQISHSSYSFLKTEGCDLILWPNLFGYRIRDISLVYRILKDNKILILDEAQSFPFYELLNINHSNLFSIFSFGKNKPLAGTGGGGVFCHKFRQISLPNDVINKANPNIIKPFFADLKDLLCWLYPSKPKLNIPFYLQIDPKIAENVSSQMEYTKIKRSYMNQSYQFFQKFLPPEYLSMLKTVHGTPTILALRINNRYQISKVLAEMGIQTTWYYYPLPLLDVFKEFPFESLLNTLNISQNIIIFPWSINHVKEDFDYLLQSLKHIIYECN